MAHLLARRPIASKTGNDMFNNRNHRLDFADTRAFSAESVLTLHGVNRFDSADTLEQMAQAEAADRNLLRLVLCAAAATLLLALASTLGA